MSKIKLSFKEHYFTASKHKGGFNTLDFTEGLRKEEINELEKKGIYNPPVKLPTNPTEEQMESLFPTNISFFKLKSSGKYVFLHSKYIGKANDSVSRHGNYFSHSLILTESNPSYPVKFVFEKATFKNSFSVEEDEAYTPKLKVEQQFEIDNDAFWLENMFRDFQTFLIQEPYRINVFSKVFDLILEGKIAKAGYNITICDKKENLTDLILAVNYFLPVSLANKVSFATYVDNPDSINYPFEIIGIIPECGIDRLPEQYFNLVEANKFSDYKANQPYTKLLTEIIANGDYSNWKNLLNEAEEFEVVELNQKLNAPASFIEFKVNVLNKTAEDFKELLLQLTEKKKVELKEFVLNKNVELYLNYVLLELGKITADTFASTSKKCDSFLSLYTQNFKNASPLSQDLFLQFTEGFRDKFTGLEKSKVSLFILSNLNCTELRLKNIDEVLQSADFYFEEESISFEEKLNAIQGFDKYRFNDIENEKIKHIMSFKKYDDLKALALKGSLYSQWSSYKKDLLNLKESDRIKLITICFNPTLTKEKFNLTFQQQISIVEAILPESQPLFWCKFFDKDKNDSYNKEKSLKYYSLEYLKKKFVSYLFLKDSSKLNLITELGYNETIVKWIQEDVTENTTDEALVERFKEIFQKYMEPPRRTWL
jgi:hypothetical protein